jgi:hypothetical protein
MCYCLALELLVYELNELIDCSTHLTIRMKLNQRRFLMNFIKCQGLSSPNPTEKCSVPSDTVKDNYLELVNVVVSSHI